MNKEMFRLLAFTKKKKGGIGDFFFGGGGLLNSSIEHNQLTFTSLLNR